MARSKTLLVLLWIVMLLALRPIARDAVTPRPPGVATHTLDPNTAPWWELTALPRIGEVTARKIVAHRGLVADDTPTFLAPGDLQRIRGIGPLTLLRIGPYLSFPN